MRVDNNWSEREQEPEHAVYAQDDRSRPAEINRNQPKMDKSRSKIDHNQPKITPAFAHVASRTRLRAVVSSIFVNGTGGGGVLVADL